MAKPLNLLIVEDRPDDAELLLLELRRAGYDVTHQLVQTADEMRAALAAQAWQLVVSDFSLPQFSAPDALSVLQSTGLDIPFLIVSGTIGEETAVDALKAGAHDFLVKGRLARLAPAIERELREARGREERRKAQRAAEDALRERIRAEEASEAKSRFLASVSHELRTPLTAIIGFSQLLDMGKVGELTPGQKDFVEKVLFSGRHLLSLINDLLDLSKIEARRMQLTTHPLRLAELVHQVADMLQPLVEQRELGLTRAIEDDVPLVLADPVRVKQIAINLLSNAIKYTPRGGRVRIELRAAGDDVELAISDTGIGITRDEQARLFREFEQLESGKAIGGGGTGLGLALAKRLTELHGGSISVESEPGRGSTFTVRLPSLGASGSSTAEPARMLAAPHAACILLVEDDPHARLLLQVLLRDAGHAVLEATTVEEARQILRMRAPSLVLTDISIPGGGGGALLREIRSNPALERVPVIATTAHAEPEDREGWLATGFDEFMMKPIDITSFVPTVDSLLSRAAAWAPAPAPTA